MSLKIIYGRAGSGKTSYCLQEIKEGILGMHRGEYSHPLVLLVPEQFTLQAERDLIRTLGTGGILDAEVLSFSRLAFRVFSQEGGITYPHIHPAGKSMIIFRTLEKRKEELRVFGKSADRQGFVNTLSALISELKRYGISPQILEEASKSLEAGSKSPDTGSRFPDTDTELRDKIADINIIYSDFERMISERFRDSDDDLTLVADRLSDCTLYDDAEIWIDGFTGFTPQEYKVINKLLSKARRVTISLCTDKLDQVGEDEVFSSVTKAYHRLTETAREIGARIEKPLFLKEPLRFSHSTELAHLEQNFYSYPYKTYPARTKDIKLFASLNPFSEIEETARDIIRLCRDEGLRFRDIAVVTRNLADYERLIEVLFTEYEIPYFMDRKVDITNHPVVRLILSMLDIFKENWSYEAVFRYLKTGLTGVEKDRVDKLENYVLACGIRGSSIWTRDQDWTMSTELLPGEKDTQEAAFYLQEINLIRREVIKGLLAFRQRTKGRRTAGEICAALYDYLCLLGVPARIENWIEQFKSTGELSLAGEYSQVWNTLMDVLDQSVEVMGDETLGLERFADILEVGLKEYRIGLIPASLDQVLVGSAERSRSHEIKALYLLGVNDGVFPSANLEEGILTDQDRTVLQKAGVELAGDTRTQAFDEQYLVYRTLAAAGRYLHLSWPIGDFEGKSMRPSMIISRLRKLFPAISAGSNILEDDELVLELLAGRSPAFRQMLIALRSFGGEESRSLWPQVYRWFIHQEDWQERCHAFRQALAHKNIAQPVSTDKIASLYGTPLYAGVSRLEKYRSCPFAFYIQYGLGARERKIYRLNPPDIGTFMHKVIEEFSAFIEEHDISWRVIEKEWCRQKVSDIVDEMLARMKGAGLSGSKRYTALTIRLKRVVTRAVWLIAEHIRASRFEPLGYELGFGEGQEFPPITVETSSGDRINLVGRIDRVDVLQTEEGTYVRIVDYKSGGNDLKISDIYHGLQLQLITYLDALRENGEKGMSLKSPILPGGVLYFRIDDPLIRRSGKASAEEIEIAIMKQLKMRGLVLADVRIIREMDNTLQGPSLILPVAINKGDVLGKASKVASINQFTMLQNHVRRLLTELCEEIMRGKVPIRPYKKKGVTSCTYCSYSAVCRFDPALKENSYQALYDKHDEDVWKLIESGGEE